MNDTGGALKARLEQRGAGRRGRNPQSAGATAVADTHSVASFEGAAAIVKTAVDKFGGVDILVNNAGILRDRTLLKMAPEEWQAVLDVHLTGTFACLQAGARQMVAQGRGGRIINTSSSSGLLGNFGQANYGAAKAGIHMLTRIASMELASKGITVNAIAPNAYTRMTKDLPGMSSFTEEEMGPQFMAPRRLLSGVRSGRERHRPDVRREPESAVHLQDAGQRRRRTSAGSIRGSRSRSAR